MGKSNNSRKGSKNGARSKGVERGASGRKAKESYNRAQRAAVRGTLANDCTAVELGVEVSSRKLHGLRE